jgi:hypothetical protein
VLGYVENIGYNSLPLGRENGKEGKIKILKN